MRIAKRIISLIMACVLLVSSADIGVYATELNEADAIAEEIEYASEKVQESTEAQEVTECVSESIEAQEITEIVSESTEHVHENTELAEEKEHVAETEVAENVQDVEETELAEETEVAEETEITETPEEPRRIPEYADLIKTEVQVISADEIEGKVYAAEELIAMKAEEPSYYSQSYGNAWDNYTSYYIYNHLSEVEKKLWDAMEVLYSSYLENETNLRHITEYVRVDTTEMSLEELQEFGDLFRYTHPQYYYLMTCLCCQVESSYVSVAFRVYQAFQDGIYRKKATNEMQLQLELWCQEIARYGTEEEKVKAIHDIICNAVDYNWEAWNAGISDAIEERDFTQSAYSVFCTDLTVCAGYTQAFTLLCNAFDIECFGVNNLGHAWNKVKVNDNWYNLDCTWDDGDGFGNIYYDYYLKNDSYMDKTDSHNEGAKWLSYLPGCTLDSGSTFNKVGKVPTVTAQAAAPVITVTKQEKSYIIEMTSATKGADIIYTLDGNMPSESNTKGYVYDGVFELNQDAVLKAIAVCDKYLDSEVTVGEEIKEIVYTVATGMAGENIAWELKSNGQMSLTGSGAMTSFTSVDKLPWAAYLKEIEELEIENGITSIANFAFANSNLREVELPDSIRSLGYDAFAECTWLTRVKICGELNHIGDAAFADCDNLAVVELPDTLTKIGKKMFYSCDKLVDINFPDSLKSIGMQAFSYCESLTEITIPGSTEMEVEVFEHCEGLEKVTIGEGVTALPWYAFYECSALKEVILPESLQKIGGYVFAKCTALTEITIPSKVAVIEMCAVDASVVIYGYAETEAQKYANKNGNIFVDLFEQGIKVSFVTGTEDTVATQYYEEESLVTEPTGLVRKGYILEGWYTSQEVQDDTTRWDFKTDVAKQSFTLYAKWIPKVESLVADIPSGSEVEAGTKVTLMTPTEGVKIYYTTESEADLRLWEADGTLDTNATLYEDGIEITKSVMFYVIAVKEGYVCSDILTVSYFVERAEQETPVLTLGTENIVSVPEWDITSPSVKCEFTVPEDGYYDFGSIVTEGDSTVSLRLLDGETMMEIDTVGVSGATADGKTHLMTSFLEKGTVLYVEYSVWMASAAQVTVAIQKVPDYTMTLQQDGSYSGETEELVLKTDIEAGCKTIRISIDLDVKEEVTGEESYYLKTYYAKKNERLEYSSTGLYRDYFDYSGTDVIEAEERTAYGMFYVLERLAENNELIPIALFESDISVTTKESEKPYVIHKMEILEDAITLDMESFVSGYIYYAPTDHSELEQKVELRNTWDSVVLENLKPGTEYYLDFVSHQNVLYGTETISTAVSEKVVIYDASCIWDESSESIRVQAEVTGYKGSADYANLYASYTDALGIKRQIIGSYYLGQIENAGVNGKDFVVWAEQSATLEAGTTYEIECWLEFGDAGLAELVVQEKQVLQVTTPETAIQAEDIVFSLSEGATGNTVCYTISAGVEENETLYGTLYYKPYGAPVSEYELKREWIPIRAGENTGTVQEMSTGVKYDMILLIEGVKKEFTDTIGTAKFELVLGEADVNIYGFSHSMEVKAKQGHTGSYELKGYYRDGKESTGYWWEFGSPITLNEANAYKTEFESASYTQLDPVSTYEIKWEVTASDGSVYTAYETIQTKMPVISFEKGTGSIDSQEYTFYLKEENVPKIENFSDDMYLFIRKAGTERFREVGLIGLNNWSWTGNTPYTCRMRIQGLDAETTYEISVRSANGSEYIEYLTTSFTTAADTRTVTVGEIEVTTKSAVIPYELSGLDGIQMTYVYLYLREKDTQTEWKEYDNTYYYYEWQNTSGEFTIGIYYGENYLTSDTTYEYLIGFGGDDEKADTLRRTITGEFTTEKDLREITVNEVTPYKSSADINYTLSNVGTEVVAVVTYVREKGTESPWIMAGYCTYLGDGNTDAKINMHYYGRVGVEQLLKEETTYEYCIGFQNGIDEGKEALEKPVYGKFTTVKDTRKVEVTSERAFFNAAKIEYQISGLECIDDTMFCLYLRKKDSGDEWEESSYTYLDALDEPSSEYVFETYKGEDLEPETTYEYIVGFKEGGMLGTEQGVEDLKQTIKREFTTLKDTREFEILSVTPGVDALEVELKVKGLENVYYCTIDSYVREKGTEEWIFAGGIGTSYQAVNQESHPMRLSDSNILGLKDETVYEYCIGISDEYQTPIEELIKPYYGEIKTPKDISKIKIMDIKIDSGRARIYFEVIGAGCRTCMGIPLFYREKGTQEWMKAGLSGSESDVLQISDVKEETDYEFKIGFITLRGDYEADEL
ncbi:MAG: leucine-rich repeat protein [Lachnospiraceae bacterium]|nr:leucine-rich repeat protein [Lachnospiraceae bacterium]